MSKIIHTKWGNATLNDKGYYRLTSNEKGNSGKYLHRLIAEEFYGKIPEGCVVHHKDGNITNNCIMNLQILPKSMHGSIHSKDDGSAMGSHSGETHPMYGKKHTMESRKKMRDSHLLGYATVMKDGKHKNGMQNYALRYNGKRIANSIFKEKLEKRAEEINKKEGLI